MPVLTWTLDMQKGMESLVSSQHCTAMYICSLHVYVSIVNCSFAGYLLVNHMVLANTYHVTRK